MSAPLDDYKKLVGFLSSILGENYEVVLQDCRTGQSGIIAIGNGNVTNRQVGGPLTDYALEIIKSKRWKHQDWDINYRSRKNNRVLRSSTYFIKDGDEDLVGMLCINIDTSVYEQLSNAIMALGGLHLLPPPDGTPSNPSAETLRETFFADISEMVMHAMSEVFGENSAPQITRLDQAERLHLVENLNEKGTFLIKGAISEVAEIMGCSESTLYRYLSKCNKAKD